MSPKGKKNNKNCSGCFKKIEDRRFLVCSLCRDSYDLECAGVSEQRFYNTLTGDHRAGWKCVSCKSRQPKTDNTNTPVRASPEHVTQRRGASELSPMQLDTTLPEQGRGGLNDTALNVTIEVSDIQALAFEIRHFREVFTSELQALREQMGALKDEVSALSGRLDRCESRTSALDKRMDTIEVCLTGVGHANAERLDEVEKRLEAVGRVQTEAGTGAGSGVVAALERTVAELKLELNDRDQDALLADLEIGGLPDEKGESVFHSVAVLAGRLGVTLEERDVVFAERVGAPPAETGGARPRRVVVRLARRQLRDDLLRAARVRRGATGEGGGRVYISERLTRFNRQLFYRAREECRRQQWRYSWTRRGRIFVRRSDGSQAFSLRSLDDLSRVFGQSRP
ncbi:uncharacterized protein LOC114353000 [Ostrinia furnacalis]|uniref:uncharacterized protein LOC114353000 n=1 Tax=Ostrinia furnacalis TaxID=93504 RepID=UPI00103FCFF8|nr:uncharacterized protein LOC114353000 [Ostrinia furnacalis]